MHTNIHIYTDITEFQKHTVNISCNDITYNMQSDSEIYLCSENFMNYTILNQNSDVLGEF